MNGFLIIWNSTEAAAAALILLIMSLFYFIYWNWNRRSGYWRRKKLLPPGSMGLPFIGETIQFISSAYSPRPEIFMDKRRLMYGRVFRSHLFGSPTIVSTDAEFSRVVLQSDASAFVPSYPRSLMELMGESSILLICGSLQKRIHGLIGSFFKSPHLKAQFTTDMEHYVHRLMENRDDGQLVFIQDEAKNIAFQILVRGLIGLKPGKEMQYLKQQFQEFIAGLISLPVKIPGTRLYRSLQAKKKMVKFVKEIIKERREMKKTSSSPTDVLDVLLSDGSEHLTDDLLSENMIDLIIPGEDSVPTLITLLVKYLGECPPALKQFEEENLQLKHAKAERDEALCWTDYLSLPFTQNVISETLRVGNIISGIMRKATRDVEIKGHFIPKGWCVFPYFRSVHLDGTIYEDPHSFNPWRWQQTNKDIGTCNFTPFGGGQRLCPGFDLARLEASIFLHHLVTNYTWVAEKDTIVNFPTVRMKGGLPIRVSRKRSLVQEEAS